MIIIDGKIIYSFRIVWKKLSDFLLRDILLRDITMSRRRMSCYGRENSTDFETFFGLVLFSCFKKLI